MPLYITWQQIAVRLSLACVASFLLGVNRDEHGRPAGMRTTMLVTLAATLAMIEVNLLLPTSGKPQGSFNTLDLMRLPLGILDGIGFIGAGTILKKETTAVGVTTAATLWYATVLGLLFGGGQLALGCTATALAAGVLLLLKKLEVHLPRRKSGSVALEFTRTGATEQDIREIAEEAHCKIEHWTAQYDDGGTRLCAVQVSLSWQEADTVRDVRPAALEALRFLPGLSSFTWKRGDR